MAFVKHGTKTDGIFRLKRHIAYHPWIMCDFCGEDWVGRSSDSIDDAARRLYNDGWRAAASEEVKHATLACCPKCIKEEK